MGRPGVVANPAHQLKRGKWYVLPVPVCASENLVSQDGFGCSVPRRPAHSPHPGWIWWSLIGGVVDVLYVLLVLLVLLLQEKQKVREGGHSNEA